MSDWYDFDPAFTAEELERELNRLEFDIYDQWRDEIVGIRAGTGASAGQNQVFVSPATHPPIKDSMVVRTFDRTVSDHYVISRIDAIEQNNTEGLLCRAWEEAWIAGKLMWVALFDKAKKAEAVENSSILKVEGKISHFGGPDDQGMTPEENTAFVWDKASEKGYESYFLPKSEFPRFGYGRRLRTKETHYLACRWNELGIPKKFLRKPGIFCTVVNPRTGVRVENVRPIDLGPHVDTGRIVDVSEAVIEALALNTDDFVAVLIPRPTGAAGRISTKPGSEDSPVPLPVAGKRRVVFLDGSYRTRKEQAGKLGCTHSIDFHFNSSDGPAWGSEVYYKPGDKAARGFGEAILKAMQDLGLRQQRANPLQAATDATRASYIAGYPCRSVLLEPMFISEPTQSKWVKTPDNLARLSQVVADAVRNQTAEDDLIGLSIGHLGNTLRPNDTGADAYGGGVETDFNAPMARRVADLLSS
jgi:hypothetical protein